MVPDVSPVPNLWVTAKESSGYHYYVILDWKDAYHQLVLALASRAFTTHGCGGRLARYAGVPQGLVGAAQRMQRCAQAVFGHIENVVCVYDNVLIRTHLFDECLVVFEEVLQTAIKHGIVLKLKELIIGTASVPFVGHTVGRAGHSMDDRLRRGLLAMQWPLSRSLAGSYARSVGWMRLYLKKSAAPLGVLLDFSRGKVAEKEAEVAFEEVAGLLRKPEVLKDWDASLQTHVIIDYSKTAISVTVEQKHEGGWLPCFYLSRKLTQAEMAAAGRDSMKGEAYALLWPLKVLKPWLAELPWFYISSDSGNLSWLRSSMSDHSLRVRSKVEEDYSLSQLRLAHVPGLRNKADAASRDENAAEPEVGDEVIFAVVPVAVPDWAPQKTDFTEEELNSLNARSGVQVRGQVVVYAHLGLERVVVPEAARYQLWLQVHVVEGLHLSLAMTSEALLGTFWWPGVSRDVRLAWRRCAHCRWSRVGWQAEPAKIQTGRALRVLPHVVWSLDSSGPYPETPRGNKYLFGARDCGSPWRVLIPTVGVTAEDAVGALRIALMWGVSPLKCTTDPGSQFASAVFTAELERLAIEWGESMPGVHEGNAWIERTWLDWNRSLGPPPERWDDLAPTYCRLANRVSSSAFGNFSAVNFLGLDLPEGKTLESVKEEVLATRVAERDAKEPTFQLFSVGDLVDRRLRGAEGKRDFHFALSVVMGVRKEGTVLDLLGAQGFKEETHVRLLTRVPTAPAWWSDREENELFEAAARMGVVARGYLDATPVSGGLGRMRVVDPEWRPAVDSKIAVDLGEYVAYVDGGVVFVGRVTEVTKEAVGLQDCRVTRVLQGRGRKRRKVLVVQPLAYDKAGVIGTKSGAPVVYRVDRGQMLTVVKVTKIGMNKVLDFEHEALAVDNERH